MSSPSDKKQSIAVWDDDLPDVVATQGAFLKSRPPTPVIWKMVHPNFHFTLCWKLEFLLDAQESRCRKYGREAAEEWLIGHTPTELRQKRAAEIEAMLEAWDAPSPPSPPSRDKPDNAKLPLQKRTRRVRSRPPPRLTTPSPSDVDGETPAPPSAVPITTSKRKIQSSVEAVGPPLDNRARKKQRITELEDSS